MFYCQGIYYNYRRGNRRLGARELPVQVSEIAIALVKLQRQFSSQLWSYHLQQAVTAPILGRLEDIQETSHINLY